MVASRSLPARLRGPKQIEDEESEHRRRSQSDIEEGFWGADHGRELDLERAEHELIKM